MEQAQTQNKSSSSTYYPPIAHLVPTRHKVADHNPFRDQMPTTLMPRPEKFNTSGKEGIININSHRILSYPTKKIWQYDVSKTAPVIFLKISRRLGFLTAKFSQINIGNGAEKRGLIKSVWESQTVRNKVGNGFIFDGNKIGWSGLLCP